MLRWAATMRAVDPSEPVPTRVEVEDVDALVVTKRPLWPFVAVGVLGVAAGVGAWIFYPREAPAWRVSIVAVGCDADCAAELEDEIEGELAEGFERIAIPEAGRAAELADAQAHAQAERALHVVRLAVETLEERPAADLDRAFIRLAVGAEVAVSDGDAETVAIAPIETAGFGTDLAAARRRAMRWVAPALAAAVHEAMLERPAVREFAANLNIEPELFPRQRAIGDQLERLELAAGARERWTEACGEADAALRSADAPHEEQCLSSGCDEHYAFDVLPDGSAALVRVETPQMFIPLGLNGGLPRRTETVTRLELVPLDGGERRTIARTTHYYTYPSLSADGSTIVALEDWRDAFGLVAIDVASGERTLLRPFTGYPQAPESSPDGTRVLLRHRVERRGEAQLVVVWADGIQRIGPRADVGAFVDVPLEAGGASRLLVAEHEERVVMAPPEVEDGEPDEVPAAEGELAPLYLPVRLALYDPDTGDVLARLEDDRHRVRSILGARNGAVVFTWDHLTGAVDLDGVRHGETTLTCGIGWWTPSSAEAPLRTIVTEPCLDQARLAPDGAIIGVARVAIDSDMATTDLEVVRVEAPGADAPDGARAEVAVLTANAMRERYPRAGREGTRVVFDRVGERRYRDFPRVATCWVDAAP